MHKLLIVIICSGVCACGYTQKAGMVINIVFISDVHYGLYKKQFRGKTHVASKDVNAAMLQQINALPMQTLPGDGGVMQDKKIGHIEDLIITGDIVNREEDTIQSASASWRQFENNYISIRCLGLSG